MNKLVLLTLISIFSLDTFAAKKTEAVDIFKVALEQGRRDLDFKPLDLPAIRKTIAAQEKKRSLATDKMSQAHLAGSQSPEYKAFVEEMLAIGNMPEDKQAQAVDDFITKYNASYATLPLDVQFVVAQMTPLRGFRSMVWRLIPAVEQSSPVQALLISQVKNTINMMRVFAPGTGWNAFTAYLTQPIAENGIAPSMKERKGQVVAQLPTIARARSLNKGQFQTEAYLQAEFQSAILPEIELAIARLSTMSIPTENPPVFDLAVVMGHANFSRAASRYFPVGEVERLAALGGLESFASSLRFQLSFRWDGAIQKMDRALGVFGFESLTSNWNPTGITASALMPILREGKWGTRIDSVSEENMKFSRQWLKESIATNLAAYEALKSRSTDDRFLIWNVLNPVSPLVQSQIDLLVTMAEDLKNEREVVLTSRITGETVRVDLFGIYASPPADLKAFLSKGPFNGGPVNKEKTIGSQKYSYRNYHQGRSENWDLAAYAKIFPDLKSCSGEAKAKDCNEKLLSYSRILMESWTGAPLAPLLAPTLL